MTSQADYHSLLASIFLRSLSVWLRGLRVRRFVSTPLSSCRRLEWAPDRGRTAHFSDTAASRSAILLSILKRSLSARENDLAIVLQLSVPPSATRSVPTYDCGLPLGFHSRSISSSDMVNRILKHRYDVRRSEEFLRGRGYNVC